MGEFAEPRGRGWLVWLAGICLFGAAIRVWRLDAWPPGLFFDVAANLFDVLDVHAGARPLWFARNNGREPLFLYLQSLTTLVWGVTPLGAKAAAALVGVATPPAAFLLGRELASGLGRRRAIRIGLLCALLTAALFWHLHFSRIGLRAISLPLFLALALGLLLRASRNGTVSVGALGGLAAGLTLYTYTSARLLPMVVGPSLLLLAFARRPAPGRGALLVYAALAIATTAPLGWYYLRHPADVEGRAASVSVLNPEVNRGDPIGAVARGVAATLGATVLRGTDSGMENLPARPLFDPVAAVGFLIGCAAAAAAILKGGALRPAAAVVFAAMLVMLLPPALSVNPPGFSRIAGAVLPAVALAALGFDALWERLSRWRPRLAGPAICAALAVSAAWTLYDYFVVWAPSEVAYRWMMEDKVQSAERVREWIGGGERVFLAPLYARDYTISFLLRETPVESFDIGATLVRPGIVPARYVFPADDREGVATVAERLGGAAQLELVADASGRFPLLTTLRAPGAPPRSGPVLASFEDGIELVEARVLPSTVSVGGILHARLVWRAEARPTRDYTVFAHARDTGGATRFQRDRMPGDGSVPTGRWLPGDLVADFLDVTVPAGTSVGSYRLVVGLYEAGSGRRLSLEGQPAGTNEIDAGAFVVGA